jgi:hypothetical protein
MLAPAAGDRALRRPGRGAAPIAASLLAQAPTAGSGVDVAYPAAAATELPAEPLLPRCLAAAVAGAAAEAALAASGTGHGTSTAGGQIEGLLAAGVRLCG